MFCSKCSISPVRVPELSPSGAQLSEWRELFAHCPSSKECVTLGLPCPSRIKTTSFPLQNELPRELPEGEATAQAGWHASNFRIVAKEWQG